MSTNGRADDSLVSMTTNTVVVPKWLATLIMSLLTSSILGLVGAVLGSWSAIQSIDTRVQIIESTRFTTQDALQLRAELSMTLPTRREMDALTIAINSLREDVSELNRRVNQ